ncbi:MAG: hypothetical protein JWP69_1185 [Flaviaesturariibacter sp.]|nr:hypothetical protein [Flaviaesturariibacter sp.]
MKVVAVIVTYNRMALLQECIAAVQAQNRTPDAIIVINNSSTDGTEQWLQTQRLTTITQPNQGGAWGFHTGIKKAYDEGADWVWVMDDDTIPYPETLEALLVPAAAITGAGFFSSKAVWTDGAPHAMNLPEISAFVSGYPFNYFDGCGAQLVKSATFVSCLISREAIRRVGLPLKEFFIWTDDHEYTDRIIRAGLPGFYVSRSMALHKTPSNHGSDIYKDAAKDIWKYKFGIRNELFYIRNRKGNFKFWRLVLKRLFVFPFRILKKRKEAKWLMIKTLWSATFSAISFHPKPDQVS